MNEPLTFGRGPTESGEPCIKCDGCDATTSILDRPYEDGWIEIKYGGVTVILCPDCREVEKRIYEAECLLAGQLNGTVLEAPTTIFPASSSGGSCSGCHRPTPANEIMAYRGRCEDCHTSCPYGLGQQEGSRASLIVSNRWGRSGHA